MHTSYKISSVLAAAAFCLLLAGFSSTASAQNNGASSKIPVPTSNFNFCVGELITLSGNANWVFTTKEVGDGCIRLNGHINWQGVTGVGQTSGKSYRVISVSNQNNLNTIICGGCTSEINLRGQYIIIGEDGKEYLRHYDLKITIDLCTSPPTFLVTPGNQFEQCD